MSTEIKMLNNISKFFYKIYVFTKQAKHISKSLAIRVLLLEEEIHIDLIRPIISIRYNSSKYDLLLTDDALHTTMRVLLKNKN